MSILRISAFQGACLLRFSAFYKMLLLRISALSERKLLRISAFLFVLFGFSRNYFYLCAIFAITEYGRKNI